jgi:nucleotide-binding universal stress UspA family protein
MVIDNSTNAKSPHPMQSIQRILCPIDFSETSSAAVALADRLAAALGAEVVLAHAFDVPETYSSKGQYRPADPAVAARLEDVKLAAPAARVKRILHAGLPGEVICWLAQDQQCDLIVMGTHGRTGLAHLFLGSVAEFVLRHARCPVLTVRPRPAGEPPLQEPVVVPPPPPRLM